MAQASYNITLSAATTPPDLVIVPGEAWAWDFAVKNDSGTAFNLTGYTVKVRIDIANDIDDVVSASTTSASTGLASVVITAATTSLWPTNSWGRMVIYADPSSGSENLHIYTVNLRTTAEAIP